MRRDMAAACRVQLVTDILTTESRVNPKREPPCPRPESRVVLIG